MPPEELPPPFSGVPAPLSELDENPESLEAPPAAVVDEVALPMMKPKTKAAMTASKARTIPTISGVLLRGLVCANWGPP